MFLLTNVLMDEKLMPPVKHVYQKKRKIFFTENENYFVDGALSWKKF